MSVPLNELEAIVRRGLERERALRARLSAVRNAPLTEDDVELLESTRPCRPDPKTLCPRLRAPLESDACLLAFASQARSQTEARLRSLMFGPKPAIERHMRALKTLQRAEQGMLCPEHAVKVITHILESL